MYLVNNNIMLIIIMD